MNSRISTLPLFGLLTILSLTTIAISLKWGSISITWPELLALLGDNDGSPLAMILWEHRLPRAYTAFITGALLAISGVLMQALLRNPLADPYILGVSGGASVGALFVMWMGWQAWTINGGAITGALCATFLVFGLVQSRRDWTPTKLLLTGVVLAAAWGAVISLFLALAPDTTTKNMLFWLIGDLSFSTLSLWPTLVLVTLLAVTVPLARHINMLMLGELQAQSLGVSTKALRVSLYFAASLATAAAVSIAGGIGFVGLIIPHILRLLIGSDHRLLLPASALAGGILLVIADTLSRTLLAPIQLPAGIFTAFLGVPVFLYLLLFRYERRANP